MLILTCRPTKREYGDLYSTYKHLSKDHPEIYEIINQIKLSMLVDKMDKEMIEQQLISMACTLNEAKNYTLVLNRWNRGNPMSVERKREIKDMRIIQDETIFTIASYSRKKDWIAYIDLPIDIKLQNSKVVLK